MPLSLPPTLHFHTVKCYFCPLSYHIFQNTQASLLKRRYFLPLKKHFEKFWIPNKNECSYVTKRVSRFFSFTWYSFFHGFWLLLLIYVLLFHLQSVLFYTMVHLVHMRNQAEDLTGISPFIIIKTDQFEISMYMFLIIIYINWRLNREFLIKL